MGRPMRIAIFRPREKLGASVRLAEGRGYEVLAVPLLEAKAYDDPNYPAFLRSLRDRAVDAVVFTSGLGVSHAVARARELEGGESFLAALKEARVFAIGPSTRAALAGIGIVAEIPPEHSSRGLVDHFRARRIAAKRIALVRSRQGSAELPEGLRAAGYDVMDLRVYELGPPGDTAEVRAFFERVVRGGIEAYVFLSSLTVRNFLELAASFGVEAEARAALSRGIVAAIGKPTRETLEREAIPVRITARQGTFESLLDALDAWRNV